MALSGAALSGAVAGSLFVGLPIYALTIGASAAQASAVLALATLSGALAFFPAGWLSDTFDRRGVILGLSLAAAALAVVEMAAPDVLGLALLFGLFAAASTPVYAICLAHGNDHLSASQIIPASGAMVFLQNIGILVGVAISPLSTEIAGGRGYPGWLAALSVAIVVISIVRRAQTEAPKEGGPTLATAGLTAPQSGQSMSLPRRTSSRQ